MAPPKGVIPPQFRKHMKSKTVAKAPLKAMSKHRASMKNPKGIAPMLSGK